ncbi:MAG: DUF4214 domain-containing protein [Steroidobacteraceae bacterium]
MTSSGCVDGWAYDTEVPFRPLIVSIVADKNREIAWGVAHGYREDLVDAGCSTGWCAFRLRLDQWPANVPWRALTVVDRATGRSILELDSLPYVVAKEMHIQTIPDLVAADPTMIQSLQQLRGCGGLFSAFIVAHGIDAFVRTAYIYLLSRSADASGLKSYRNHLRAKNVTPYELLLAIADSDEYRSRPRQHVAPIVGAFPFRVE